MKRTDDLVGCFVALAVAAVAVGIWMRIPLLVVVSPAVALVALGWGIYRHAKAGTAGEEEPEPEGDKSIRRGV